jgi:hypothetical protein
MESPWEVVVTRRPPSARSADRRSSAAPVPVVITLAVALLLAASPRTPALQPANTLPEAVVAALQNPQVATLYSIEPGGVSPFDTNFHHYEVLGKSRIDRDEARRVLADLQQSLSRPNGGPALCFEPHHLISVHAGAHTYDLVICYLCGGLRVYRDGSLLTGLLLSGTPQLLNELAATHGRRSRRYLAEMSYNARRSSASRPIGSR